ncbi:hypothetical protein J7J60_01820, partial [bacterium]|nr:hypothetical protein [bacterium]
MIKKGLRKVFLKAFGRFNAFAKTFKNIFFLKKKKNKGLFLGAIIGIIALFSLVSFALAWTEPTESPPEGNVPPPLNRGSSSNPWQVQYTWDKIGIGTSSPSYYLHVYGSGESTIGIQSTADAAVLSLKAGTSSPSQIIQSLDNSDLRFWVNGDYRLVVDSSGKVGIGTTSPEEVLEVGGNLLISKAGVNPVISAKNSSGTTTLSLNTSGDSYFTGGSLGIGTESPSGLLDVNNKLVVSDEQVLMNVPLNLNAPGDLSLASDLQFTDLTASYIKSYAPLYIQAGDSNHNYDLFLKSAGGGSVIVDDDLEITGSLTAGSYVMEDIT